MAEWIDRENYCKNICRCASDYCEKSECSIWAAPTADVAEVVRCKDCEIPHNKWTGCPKLNGTVTDPDFYCAAGIRKAEKGGAHDKAKL